ncbi:hypothetical protein [Azospirillum griseum]|uniref:Uncharacterized protein n=1 Tax=Azospirillum griseum TaxID=2496639 RepID=A0A431VI56_9PROT|nr:hypothetical protein [Azospirillum griseum]RTR19822.1 hypothetical protein EJ903_12530 [Azospirillum griseum]
MTNTTSADEAVVADGAVQRQPIANRVITDHAIANAARLTQIGDRTSLMAIDATLRLLPAGGLDGASPLGLSNAAAAQEVRELARRMLQATQDFQAAIREPADG